MNKLLKLKIDKLDLSAIKFKLVREKGWTETRVNNAEIIYKGFLYLCSEFPNIALVPTEDMDEIWHNHILDTVKYMEDCDNIFGHYLHHFPYLGIRSKEDEQTLKDTFEKSINIFKDVLNIDVPALSQAGTCYSNCGNRNEPVKSAGTCYSNCGNRTIKTAISQERPSLN